jgi:hypothetical protein
MPSEQFTFFQQIGLIPFYMGITIFVLCGIFWKHARIRYLAMGFFLIFVGLMFLSWIITLIIFGFPAGVVLVLSIREVLYEKRFPVFVGPPVETIHEENGFEHHLHIREWRSKFIIGIDYEIEVDGTLMRYKTRWTDRFSDHKTAENELRRRFTEWQGSGCMRGSIK